MSDKQTLGFQTEVKQLLHLMINSLYSNKEIFLRELVSNSSDAADKLRFLAISKPELLGDDSNLAVYITVDKAAKTITLRDNGIGMSRDEAVDNLGTIAKSGSREFLAALSGDQAKDRELIGQFGVGFYSSFIVADKVTVKSRRAELPPEAGVLWISKGEGDFEVETITKADRGTEITLHLKADADEFLEETRIRHIINKYCDHINLPVMMLKSATPDETEPKTVNPEFEAVNKATALWTLPKKDISDEQYKEFYKYIAHDYSDPAAWSHNRVEGKQEYISLLYLPARAPFDLYDVQQKHGLKLYVQKVFILDNVEHFLPRYLRFTKGVIDSKDLPLNVSREILQHSQLVDKIKAASAKRILAMFESLAANTEEYQKIWDQFGKVLKEGPVEDQENKDKIAKLLRFASSKNDSTTQNVSLDTYLSRMVPQQDTIYYITAESYVTAKHSPQLEAFNQKGIEVLLLTDPIDEWLVNSLTEFEGKKLQSVAKGDLDLSKFENEQQKEEQEKLAGDFTETIKALKETLADKVQDVRITHRLTSSPSCVVNEEDGFTAQMQKMLQAAGHALPAQKPILEINPKHKLVLKLKAEKGSTQFKEWAELLFDEAILAEGRQLADPAAFVQRLNRLLETIG
jgi:molecular chaperone HtpG